MPSVAGSGTTSSSALSLVHRTPRAEWCIPSTENPLQPRSAAAMSNAIAHPARGPMPLCRRGDPDRDEGVIRKRTREHEEESRHTHPAGLRCAADCPSSLLSSPLRVAMHPHSMRTRRSWRLWRSSSVSRRFHLARAMSPRDVRHCQKTLQIRPRTGTRRTSRQRPDLHPNLMIRPWTDSSRIRSVGSHHSIHHPSHHSIHHPSHHRSHHPSCLEEAVLAAATSSPRPRRRRRRAHRPPRSPPTRGSCLPCADRPSRRSTRS